MNRPQRIHRRAIPVEGSAVTRLGALLLVTLAGALGSLMPASVISAQADPSPAATTSSCPASNPPDELTLAGGSPQTAKLDSPFASPFQVTLANSNGCPVTIAVAGTPVTFTAPANGSSTASGAFAASGSSAVTVGADASGNAATPTFTANDIAGSYTVTASSSYGSVAFSLTNTAAGIAVSLTPQAPLSEAAFTSARYNEPLQVVVLDANGNPVEGAAVTFSLGSSGGGGTGAGAGASSPAGATFATGDTQAAVTTNASGLAVSPLFTANAEPGAFSASAATPGVAEPAIFKLDNVAGKPPAIRLVGSLRRSAVVGDRYRAPLQVRVLDAAGTPVQGATVTFVLGAGAAGSGAGAAAGSGGGAAGANFLDGSTQATETTGPRGFATSPLFVANGSAGTFTATVALAGRTNPLAVTLANLAGKPPVITALGAAHAAATVDTRYRRPLAVKVVAADGLPIEGMTVSFSLGTGGAGGSGAGGASGSAGASFLGGASQVSESTNAHGVAFSPVFTAGDTPGAFTATASISGVSNPVSFGLDNLAAKPPVVRAEGPLPRSATVGGRFPQPLRVRVVAADGKPVQGTSVTFTLGGSGAGAAASGSSGSAGAFFVGGGGSASETTNAAGVAVSPAFTANTVAGAFTASASAPGTAAVANFPLRNLAGRATSLTVGAAGSEQTTVNTRFPILLAVTVKDADGNPVAGAVVTFTAPSRGASGRFAAPGAGRHVARVRTNSDGIALAPPFGANHQAGGYVVKAAVKGAAVVAFALVNQPPGP